MKRRMARKNPSTGAWVLIGGGAVLAGVAIYFMTRPKAAAASPALAPTASVAPQLQITSAPTTNTIPATPVANAATSLTTGQAYTLYGAIPAGGTSSGDLSAAFTASGWTNVAMPYFAGQGTVPAGISSPGASGFVATGVWSGPNGTAVSPGYICVAGRCSEVTYV